MVQILAALWFARNKLADRSLCVAVLVLVFVLVPVPAMDNWDTGGTLPLPFRPPRGPLCHVLMPYYQRQDTQTHRDYYRPEELLRPRRPLPMLCTSEPYSERAMGAVVIKSPRIALSLADYQMVSLPLSVDAA